MPRIFLAPIAALAIASFFFSAPAAASAPVAPKATFIVTLRPGVNVSDTTKEWRGKGASVSHVYSHALSGFAATVGPDLADLLRADSRVARIERDGVVRTTGTQTNPTWGLDRIDERSLPLEGTYTYDTTAAGVAAYIIDTGVRPTHVDFGGRVSAGYTSIADGRGSNDCNGHGTHVAGTAAGVNYGAAKAATVIPVRVLGCDGSGTWSGVIAGIDWMTAHHAAGVPAVANMSLGGGANSSVDTALRNAIADGITVVVAAGNENGDACTTSPARVAEALTVAATTSSDARASFSNWGSCVDLFAPGSSVTSAYYSSDTAVATMSGTSMASPHVAGIAALYLAGSPAATPANVQYAVNNAATANVVTNALGSPNRLAYSRIAATSASAPAAPAAPTLTAASRAVSVAWTAPNNGGSAITSYTVRVYSAKDGTVVKTVTVGGSTTKTSVGGLQGNVSYYSRVRATNAVGSSAWSPASRAVTTLR